MRAPFFDHRKMPYRLKEGLSFCVADGHLVFLDLAEDRYFRLSSANESIFRAFLAHGDVLDGESGKLVRAGVLVEAMCCDPDMVTSNIQRPVRSALEQPAASARYRPAIGIIAEVMATVLSTRQRLRSRPLKDVVDNVTSNRRSSADPNGTTETALVSAAIEFSRARRYVPIEPSCLLDSLSLVRFLSRRCMPATIVFGVALTPFAAHCWVQSGDMVLNDTLSNANAHTPIRAA